MTSEESKPKPLFKSDRRASFHEGSDDRRLYNRTNNKGKVIGIILSAVIFAFVAGLVFAYLK